MVHPYIYREEIRHTMDYVEEDLKFLIRQEFDNNYTRRENDRMIIIESILGSPVIGRLRVDTETDKIQCRYCFWDGKSLTINPEGEWVNIPELEILNIYEGLYNIIYSKNLIDDPMTTWSKYEINE